MRYSSRRKRLIICITLLFLFTIILVNLTDVKGLNSSPSSATIYAEIANCTQIIIPNSKPGLYSALNFIRTNTYISKKIYRLNPEIQRLKTTSERDLEIIIPVILFFSIFYQLSRTTSEEPSLLTDCLKS